MISRSSWQRSTTPLSGHGSAGKGRSGVSRSSAATASVETSNGQYGEWANRDTTAYATPLGRANGHDSSLLSSKQVSNAALNDDGRVRAMTAKVVDVSRSSGKNVGWKPIVAGQSSASNRAPSNLDQVPAGGVLGTKADRWRTTRVPIVTPSAASVTTPGDSFRPPPLPLQSGRIQQPPDVGSLARIAWHLAPSHLQQPPTIQRSTTTLSIDGSRATKDAITAVGTMSHVDLLRDFARYRQLQSGVIAASSLATHQQRTNAGAGDNSATTSRDRRLVNRPTHAKNTSSIGAETEASSKTGSNARSGSPVTTVTITSLKPDDRGGISDVAAADELGVNSSTTSGDVTAPRLTIGDPVSRSWMMSRQPSSGYSPNYRFLNESDMKMPPEGQQNDLMPASATSESSYSQRILQEYQPSSVSLIDVADSTYANPRSADVDPRRSIYSTSGPSVIEDHQPNESRSELLAGLSVPDLNAIPKRSILKKSNSYASGGNDENVTAFQTHASPRGLYGGSVGQGLQKSATINDFARSPSMPLLYRQRTFGGPQVVPRSFDEVGARHHDAVGTMPLVRANGHTKRVTFRI